MTLIGRRIAILAATVVVLAVIAAVLMTGKKRPETPAPKPASALAQAGPPALTVYEETIRKGQTLSDFLAGFHFSSEEIQRLIQRVRPVFRPDKIIAGRRMRLTMDADLIVRSIEYPLDEKYFLVITRDGSDFKAEKKEYVFTTAVLYLDGMIEDNPINAFLQRGEKEALAIRMTDLFAWDIDFYTELRRGDAFQMVYEKKYLDGKFYGYGEILTAEFVCQGKTFRAFRFEFPDPAKPEIKKADYFDREGKSLRKEFLRSPLPYGAPITSRFSYNRLHPIRKVYTAHLGVDYGAPVGMPVHATADGTVLSAGSNGAAGNMVHIRHRNSYETMYLHLSAIFVKAGQKVSGGQVIGTVGNSGESTGPHLDYRVKQGGIFVNPLSWKFLPVEPLRPEFKEAFKKVAVICDLMLDAPLVLRESFRR